jgi:hypothetical protein
VRNLRVTYPGMTVAEIADYVGVPGSLVRDLLAPDLTIAELWRR